ncbi:diaminopimelate epimerase [Oleiphilus messinensis]|uniref:Diaminopimelate epimerase n=2 Tax=Oleiphilus messinensis TaxID=141451 RepID=A0A1Y0I4V4_9GAMM|nr:diaminopimelate epimerase [Oleiphilus messinensis]
MHGLGNDFMVIDAISQHVHIRPEQVKRLSDRHFGIGFDQLLLVEPPGQPDVDFRYRIFNADGSEVEQCGNGARCFALYVSEKKLVNKPVIRVQTAKGVIELKLGEEGLVTVDMGKPRLTPADIPFLAEAPAPTYQIDVQGVQYDISAVSMGNPHGVLVIDDVLTAPLESVGATLESHERFPERANIGFMEIVHPGFVKLRVFERGAGETMACGSGACAAVVAGRLRGLLDSRVEVKLPGGNLRIQWDGEGHPVLMEGPAAFVFEGQVRL